MRLDPGSARFGVATAVHGAAPRREDVASSAANRHRRLARCGQAVCAAAVAVLAGGCALNPVTRRPEVVLISADMEKQLGKEEAEKVEQAVGFVDAPVLSAYVDTIGARLAAQSPRQDVDYTFHVIDLPEPNAFALPGGYVYVTRGLLARANSEDELACVMGHEIGHVAARHTVQQISASAPFALITGISAGVTGLVSPALGRLVGGMGGLASGVVLAPYSRGQEREADQVGQQLAAEAGWDPASMAAFLETLQREQQLRARTSSRLAFLDSHPSTPERIENTTAYAQELAQKSAPPISGARAEFLERLDGLVVGRTAANGVFDGPLFLHADLDFALLFPRDWQFQNGREQVAALAPNNDALLALQLVAEGDDPLAGARELERQTHSAIVKNAQATTIGGQPAARTRVEARGEQGDVVIDLTWIAYRGRVYQISGVAPQARAGAYLSTFEVVARSFRPLSAADHQRIREDRLRIVRAQAGEMLDSLVTRTGSVWNVEMVAAINGVSPQEPLQAGQLVKVAVNEPYALPAVQ